ncbi:MAG: signal peptidase II [Eubacteriales bacterium]
MYIWFILMALIVFIDQLTKYLTVFYLKPVDTCPIIQDVLHLTYVENRGAAFGMLSENRWVFMTVSIVAILLLAVYLIWKKPKDKWVCLSLSFIIGGGIGNMIDRVALGYVVDMIDFRLIHFAVFNVADSFVCVGAGILMVWLIVTGFREYKAEKAARVAASGAGEDSDMADSPAEDASDDPVTDAETADTASSTEATEDATEDAHDDPTP